MRRLFVSQMCLDDNDQDSTLLYLQWLDKVERSLDIGLLPYISMHGAQQLTHSLKCLMNLQTSEDFENRKRAVVINFFEFLEFVRLLTGNFTELRQVILPVPSVPQLSVLFKLHRTYGIPNASGRLDISAIVWPSSHRRLHGPSAKTRYFGDHCFRIE